MTLEPQQPADHIDVDRIALTIDHALAPRTELPPREELADLEQLLRGHIQLLLPEVRQVTDRMWRGSREWELRQSTLDSVGHVLDRGLDENLMAAAAHVHELGRLCRFLLDYYRSIRASQWCAWHKGRAETTTPVRTVPVAGAPGALLYACDDCRAQRRLAPLQPGDGQGLDGHEREIP